MNINLVNSIPSYLYLLGKIFLVRATFILGILIARSEPKPINPILSCWIITTWTECSKLNHNVVNLDLNPLQSSTSNRNQSFVLQRKSKNWFLDETQN